MPGLLAVVPRIKTVITSVTTIFKQVTDRDHLFLVVNLSLKPIVEILYQKKRGEI